MSRFIEFLADAAVNADSFAALVQTPDKIMTAAGLTEEEQGILRARNSVQMSTFIRRTENKITVESSVTNNVSQTSNSHSRLSW